MTQPDASRPGNGAFELSMEQEWAYAARLAEPDRRRSIELALGIRGPLDAAMLLESLQLTRDRHPGLRVRLELTSRGDPRQVVSPPPALPPVACQAVTSRSREQFDSYARRIAALDQRAWRSPVRDPLCRFRLLRYAADQHVFLAAFDQLAFDQHAVLIFERDMWRAYRHLRGNTSCGLPAGSDVASSVARQRCRYEHVATTVNARYWAERYALALQSGPPLAARQQPQAPGGEAAVQYQVGAEAAGKLTAARRAAGFAPEALCLAAVARLAFGLTAQDRVVVHTSLDTREPGDENVVGMFTAVRPLTFSQAPSQLQVLSQAADQVAQARAHRHVQRPAWTQLMGGQNARSRLPSAATLFAGYATARSGHAGSAEPPELRIDHLAYPAAAPAAALAVSILDIDNDLRVRVTYDTAVVSADMAVSLPERLDDELSRMAEAACGMAPAALRVTEPVPRPGPELAASRQVPQPAGLAVSRLGFGAMRLTGPGIWGEPSSRPAAVRLLRRAAELGVDFIDTADSYGPSVSEELIAEALHPYRGLTIATKGGLVRPGPGRWYPLGRPEYLQQCVEMSLRRLRTDAIGLYQLHRIDPAVPLADQLGALEDLRIAGKIVRIGLCAATVPELAEARLMCPVASVQNQYHLMNRAHEGVLDYCQREGLAFIAFAPLGSGRLGQQGTVLAEVAADVGASPAQVALAWLLRRSRSILPIPGTGSARHLEENLAATDIQLSEKHLTALAGLTG